MDIEVLQRSLAREKAQRNLAEQLLEDKSRELYHSYEELQRSHADLELAHDEVKLKQDQLVQSEKMASLGILSAGVAHEINNPIAFVFSNINSLAHASQQFKAYFDLIESNVLASDEPLTPEQRQEIRSFAKDADIEFLFEDCSELIVETIDGIQRVKEIVSGLQAFSRADSGMMEPLDINLCVQNTLKIASGKLKDGCIVEEHLGELPEIKGFPGKIGQVILNLLVNAGQAITDNGVIKITTQLEGAMVHVSVEDNGCGMADDVVDDVFTPFFTTKPVGTGTGLGLSISHGIVEEHSGKIIVQSEVGIGTRFTVCLPVENSSLELKGIAA